MSKRTFIILIIFVIFLGTVGFVLITGNFQFSNIEVEKTPETGFNPFDGSSLNDENNSSSEDEDSNQSVSLPGSQSISDFDIEDSKLVQIASEPVAGFTLVSKSFEITEDPEALVNDSLVETYNFFDFGTLRFGQTGEGVTALQTILNRFDEQAELTVSGSFDTPTKNAVISFQTKEKLTPDGIVGKGTATKLNQLQGLSTKPEDFVPGVRIEIRPTVRYQLKSNGHIYDLGVDDRTFEKISSTGFSAVHESFFGNGGDTVVVRYAQDDTISTYLGDILRDEEGAYSGLSGEFLAPNIPFVSISNSGNNLVYYQKKNGKADGVLLDLKTKESSALFTLPFTEWLPQLTGDATLGLTTLASSFFRGYSYHFDASQEDSYERTLGDRPGLTTNYSLNGEKILASESNGKFIRTLVHDTQSGETLNLGIKTLSEKCVWTSLTELLCAVPRFVSPSEYPDAWYKGQVLFDDRLWSINTENGVEMIVSSLKNEVVDKMDMINPMYFDGILLFQNKYDNTLWMLDMREE